MRRSLLWQMYPAVLLILLVAIGLIYWTVSDHLERFYRGQQLEDLQVRGQLIRFRLGNEITSGNLNEVDRQCKSMGAETGTRITIIDRNGKVLGESQTSPRQMENHIDRPEVQQVIRQEKSFGVDIRSSDTLKKRMMYVAIPLFDNDQRIAVIRTAKPISKFESTLAGVQEKIVHSAIIVAVILAGASWLVCWQISKPIRQVRRGAKQFAGGNLEHRLAIPRNREVASLARSMNKMAADLSQRIETITAQRNEQQAVLSSMAEGVLAVDTSKCCLSINKAACKMLQVNLSEPTGRMVPEIVRNVDLQEFITEALQSTEPAETRIVLHEATQQRHLQVHGTALLNGQDQRIGAVIVLNDISELHKLQQLRTDFVANVSHELKTPVTSIKGFIETLLDGAKDRPQDLQRFLEIVSRQTERLNSIIDDLLTLSRIEQQTEKAQIALESTKIRSILKESIEICQHRAQNKQINLQLICQADLNGSVNPSLLEQALVNLIDNAVKYSEAGSSVQVRGYQSEQALYLEVEDSGCGISTEHHSRLFERFYRVDKARSRKLGGTGLGLAIVKHIVQAHHGSITVESAAGSGSTFIICLPIKEL